MSEDQVHQPIVSVIAAGPGETVPSGIAWELVRLASLQTDEVRAWVAEHRTGEVYVIPGMEMASQGTAALTVNVSEDEYLALAAAMPR